MRHLRFFAFFAFAAMILSLAACQKTPDAELFLSNKDFSLEAQGGYINVSVSTNVNLTITISDSWITSDGALEGGSGTYGFTVAFNEGYEGRTGSITFSNAESGLSETVTISQKQQDAILLGGNEYRLFYEAQTLSLPVSSNVDYSVSITGGDWLKSMGTRGLTSKELQFSVAENTGKEPREAIINITSGTLKQSIKVEQLPTTHKPQTEEELINTIKLVDTITEQSEIIIQNTLEESSDSSIDASVIANKLMELDGVLSAEPSPEGDNIIVMQKDSLFLNVLLNTPGQNTDTKRRNKSQTLSLATRSNSGGMIIPNGKSALILAPFQFSFDKPLDSYKELLSDVGYTVEVFEDDKADISKFEGEFLQNYDVIIIDTHGGYHVRNSTHVEFTSITSGTRFYRNVDPGDFEELFYIKANDDYTKSIFSSKKLYDDYFVVIIDGKSYLAASNLNLHSAHFDDKFVFLSACLTGKDVSGNGSLMKAISDRNAGAVLGYDISIGTNHNNKITTCLLLYLGLGFSLEESIAYCKYNLGEDYLKPLITLPKGAKSFHLFDPRPSNLKAKVVNNLVTLTWATPKTGIGKYLGDASYIYDIYVNDVYVGSCVKPLYTLSNLSSGEHDIHVVTRLLFGDVTGKSFKSDVAKVNISFQQELIIKTDVVKGITYQGAQVPVTIEANYSFEIAERGVVYSSSNSTPTIGSSGCKTATSSSTGNSFLTQLNALSPGTKYYARGYVIVEENNSRKTHYGNVVTFTTSEAKPAIAVDRTSLVFQDTQVGKTSTASFVITNTGTANLIVTLSGAGGVYSMDWTSGTITPNGGSQKVTVTFAPNKAADFSSTIKISSNAGSDKTISLSGKGISAVAETAKIKVSKTELTFKDRKNGESDTQSFTIMNTGTANLKVSISDPGAPFSLSWREKTIGPNHYESLSVVFAPDQAGDFKATLQISSNATNGTQHVTLTGKGLGGGEEQKPVIQVSTSSVLFGNVLVGNTGTQTITVSNTGNKALTIKKITCPSGFSASWTSKTIASKGSEPLTITFTPTSAKAFSGNLVIESDASNGTSKTLTLSGTGVAKPEPRLSISTNLVNFGEQILSNQDTRTLTITNSGTGTLEISSITKSSTYGDLFTISGWVSGGSITAGDSKTITISFMPIEERTYEETLTIVSSNAVGVRTQTVTLRGTGIPVPEDARISFSASSLSWGSVEVGESVAKTFTISNPGSTALNISSIKVVASDNTQNPDYFTISPSSSCTINAGKSKSFTVTFSPKSAKSYSATVSIKSNATNATQGTSLLDLSGTGTEVQTPGYLEASPSTLNYGDVTVGSSLGNETGRVVFTNTGGSDVSISSIDCPTGFSHSSSLSFPIVVSPGSTKTITFAFKPTEVKSYSGYIQVNSNASNGVLKVKVTGNGIEEAKPSISASPTSINYGDVTVGQALGNETGRVTFTNTGDADLSISSIDCPTGFSYSSALSFPIVVSPGSTKTITFAFKPTEVKAYSGYIQVNSNASNGVLKVKVTGNGIEEAKPSISASPTSINYGDVTVGQALGNETGRVTFTNTGDADLSISSIDCPTGFSYSSALSFPIVVSPGSTKTITFAFKPTEVKAYSGYIQVNSNASNGVLKVKVTGNGIEEAKPSISASPTSINYGDVTVGQALGNETGRVTFTNTGDADLSISSIDCPTGFSYSSALSFPIVVSPGDTKTIVFAFKPTAVKTYSGYIQVNSNASNGVLKVKVTGNGVE